MSNPARLKCPSRRDAPSIISESEIHSAIRGYATGAVDMSGTLHTGPKAGYYFLWMQVCRLLDNCHSYLQRRVHHPVHVNRRQMTPLVDAQLLNSLHRVEVTSRYLHNTNSTHT